MNILIVSQYFYPENFRINDFAFSLVKKGHDVWHPFAMNYWLGGMPGVNTGITKYKVNEEGMEMFMPLMPGKIIPAKETAMAMGGGGGAPFVNAPVNNITKSSGSTNMMMASSSTDKSNWKYGMQGA